MTLALRLGDMSNGSIVFLSVADEQRYYSKNFRRRLSKDGGHRVNHEIRLMAKIDLTQPVC